LRRLGRAPLNKFAALCRDAATGIERRTEISVRLFVFPFVLWYRFCIIADVAQSTKKSSWPVRLVKMLLLIIIGSYLVVCGFMAVFQRSLLYFPAVYTPAQVDQMARSAKLERWTNSAGTPIGFKRLSPAQPATGTVMICYGNGSTAVGCAHYADDIQHAAAMDVFILEYPGYEDRPGSPNQTTLIEAAEEAFQQLPTNRPVYLLGESLGTGMVSWLAGRHPDRVAGMVLISPYNRITSVAQNHYPYLPVYLLMFDRFAPEDYLKDYHGRVGITVGGKDTIVPEKFGRRLYDGYGGPKKLWAFPDGDHCQIMEPPADFWQEAVAFWLNSEP
jgi:uncharacterized protein